MHPDHQYYRAIYVIDSVFQLMANFDKEDILAAYEGFKTLGDQEAVSQSGKVTVSCVYDSETCQQYIL